MNNQAEKFHQENANMIQQLVESLDAILEKFDQGIIPGDPEKSDALYMLDTYIASLIQFKETKKSAFVKITDNKYTSFDENALIRELTSIRESIEILLRLGREKILFTDDNAFQTSGGKALIEYGYCDEITVETGDTHYYILSEKGEKAIRSKSLLNALRKDVCTAIIPQGVLNDSFKWSDLYVRRVEMINKYFRNKRENAAHVIFSLDESKDLVFGCEINDSENIDYVFAGVFNEKIDDHIAQIKSLASSGKIDHIIIINSSEDGKSLLEGEGLSTIDYPQIKYELLN